MLKNSSILSYHVFPYPSPPFQSRFDCQWNLKRICQISTGLDFAGLEFTGVVLLSETLLTKNSKRQPILCRLWSAIFHWPRNSYLVRTCQNLVTWMKNQLLWLLQSLQSKQYAIREQKNKSFLSSFTGQLGDLKIRAYPFKSTLWRPSWWWANKNAGGKTPEGHQRLETKHYVVFLTNVCKENT